MALWSKGRCSVLKSNLKGHTSPDTGERAAASPSSLFVALELNVRPPPEGRLSQRRHTRACAFGDDDFKASSGTAV